MNAGVLFFPIERAARGAARVARVGAVGAARGDVDRADAALPPIPDLPPFLSGQSFVVVEAVVRLPQDEADRLLAPLRALGPAIDTFAMIPTSELGQLHMDPPGPVPGIGDGMLLAGLPFEAVEAALAASGPGVDSPLLSVEFRHLGGALAPGASDGGAIAGFDAEFAMFAVGHHPDAGVGRAVRAAVDGVQHGSHRGARAGRT